MMESLSSTQMETRQALNHLYNLLNNTGKLSGEAVLW
jgi:hypothetical protein